MTDSIIVSSTELSVNINPPAVQTISATTTSLELVINQQPLVSVDVIKSLDNTLSVLREFSSSSDIPDFVEAVDDRVNSLLIASTGIRLDYNDAANTLTIATTGVLLNTILPITYNNLSNSTTNSLNVQKRTAKAWINFNGTGTISIRDSFNISSIVDNGIGMYTINFATAMPDTNYCVVAMGRYFSNDIYSQNLATLNQSSTKTVSSVAIVSNYSRGGTKFDCSELNIIIFAS